METTTNPPESASPLHDKSLTSSPPPSHPVLDQNHDPGKPAESDIPSLPEDDNSVLDQGHNPDNVADPDIPCSPEHDHNDDEVRVAAETEESHAALEPRKGRPRGPGRKQLTEAQRTRVRILFFDGHKTQNEIKGITDYSLKQIRTAIQSAVPRHGDRGRKSLIDEAMFAQLEQYVTGSKEGRSASWETLASLSASIIGVAVGWEAVRGAFYRHGYKRYRTAPRVFETRKTVPAVKHRRTAAKPVVKSDPPQ